MLWRSAVKFQGKRKSQGKCKIKWCKAVGNQCLDKEVNLWFKMNIVVSRPESNSSSDLQQFA